MIKVPDELFDAGEEPLRRVLVVLAAGADGGAGASQTPLAEAETVALDRIAREGRIGLLEHPGGAFSGCSPWEGFTGLLGLSQAAPSLGVAVAWGAGIDVPPDHVAYRADFVTVDERGVRDPSAGGVGEPEATALLDAAREAVLQAVPGVELHRLDGARNLAILPAPAGRCLSPWEATETPPVEAMPAIGMVRAFFLAASEALAGHDVNTVRVDLGENPANALWLHGGGNVPPALTAPWPMPAEPPLTVALVGSGLALRGLARHLGARFVETGEDHDDLAAGALGALAEHDLVVVRTTAALRVPRGDVAARREILSAVDARVVAPLLSALEERGAYRLSVAADSVLDEDLWRLVPAPSPFAELSSDARAEGLDRTFNERNCERTGVRLPSAALLSGLAAPRA